MHAPPRIHFDPVHPPVFRLGRKPETRAEALPFSDSGAELIPIRPGLSLTLTHFHPEEPLTFRVEAESTPLSFCCYLSGTRLHQYEVNGNRHFECRTEAGTCTLSRFSRMQGQFLVPPGEYQSAIGLQIEPADFPKDLDATWIPEPNGMAGRICEDALFIQSPIPPEMHPVLAQISDCPHSGSLRTLYLESKGMELLSLYLSGFAETSRKIPPRPEVHAGILAAARILDAELHTPPTIGKLARRVGLNECSLKSGFRDVFATTVHGYLVRNRMETARRLLLNEKKNVSEAAWDVGYTNVSHFIAVFRKHYGMTPGCFLKHHRQQVA